MKYIEQSANNIFLNINFGDNPDTKNLTLLEKNTINVNKDIYIEFNIIGESHFFSIYKDKINIFTEIFACVNIENSEYNKQMNNTEFHKEFKNKNIETIFETKQITTIYGIEKTLNYFNNHEYKILEYNFPSHKNDKFKAMTAIAFDLGEKIVETLHSYPNENIVVITRSKLNIF